MAAAEATTHVPTLADLARRAQRLWGTSWNVVLDGRRARARHSSGMHHLAGLLAAPGREFHVLDLAAADSDEPAAAGNLARAGNLGPLLNDRTKPMYRRRLTEIQNDTEEARADRSRQAGTSGTRTRFPDP